jgi:hypothetical protein
MTDGFLAANKNHVTFSLAPDELVIKRGAIKKEDALKLVFRVRCLLEAKGYRPVEQNETADFKVTVQGRISKSRVDEADGGRAINAGGGKFTTARIGVTLFEYLPIASASVVAAGGATWSGKAVGAHKVQIDDINVVLGCQSPLGRIVGQFPDCLLRDPVGDQAARDLGLQLDIRTRGGQHFYPMLVEVQDQARADREGLRKGDTLMEINGKSLEDRSYREVMNMFADGLAATKPLKLKIWRDGWLTLNIPTQD